MSSRGVKNNNPFNIIKTGISWFGELKGLFSKDSKFEQFETLELGIRAGLLNLKNGYKLRGYNTPMSLIERYAPDNDNAKDSQFNYQKAVALGVFGSPFSYYKVISTNLDWLKAASAMMKFENGYDPISFDKLTIINNNEKIFI